MNRRRADLAAGLLVGAVVLVGLLFTWDAYARRRAFQDGTGGMMGGSGMMGSMMYSGPDPVWYLAGTLIIGVGLLGGYVLLRSTVDFEENGLAAMAGGQAGAAGTDGQEGSGPATDPERVAGGDAADADAEQVAEMTDQPAAGDEAAGTGAESSGPDILAVLPDDERRVLEPVVDSPGLTQIALRDRSGFSKSKVSQTVSDLEKRGLIYREKQGRTFRVYPAEDLAEQ